MKQPENMTDKELAENLKSYYLQVENDIPSGKDEAMKLRALRKEADKRNLELLSSVRILNGEEVLAE